ncbi:LacI family DNA-binding transcriptional regulator [Ruficoccus sp. ZRK36]|uniref:LacI family DNA-binding transcriptional regulator n=1 Tax=Ruficoccus sp. ZRK36 TaxID=2866311 RepID=UPI001C732350|nr:LacI family DNA-binding transcriptional regulator [Ruficoccus sp. ZRK36]QYY34516.1 LacI family transcriptional regulator [Ruficoccus sp. ZRK36]
MPTLRDISNATGYALSTVSLALRNDPSLKPETLKAIQEAAHELGYRPNPLVSALMRQVRDKRCPRKESVAIISRFTRPIHTSRKINDFYRMIYDSANKQAEMRGYGVDEFYLGDNTISDSRISGILKARGIHGVLLLPGRDNDTVTMDYPLLNSPDLTTVLVGFNTSQRNLHQVATDYYYDIDCAIQRALHAGYTRIGLAIDQSADRATNHTWASRFLFFQQSMPEEQRVPVLLSRTISDLLEESPEWYSKHRPEVILISIADVKKALAKIGISVPGDVRLIHLTNRGNSDMAGINPHTERLGSVAVDLLVQLLQTNQFGPPSYPQTVAIKGSWSPGYSFPEDQPT